MVGETKGREGLFSYLDIPRRGEREPVTDMVVMAIEFMKYQGEVAYEIGKRQAIALASTASTIGIGWSAFFFGIAQESWLTTSLGLMMVFAGTYLLGFWTPRVVDKARTGIDKLGAAKFYEKWLSDYVKPGVPEKRQ
jgi:hypothetical protein